MKLTNFLVIFMFLNSCSAPLTGTLLTPDRVASILADIVIESNTGKKISEHALSSLTEKDCKLKLSDINNICIERNVASLLDAVEKNKTQIRIKVTEKLNLSKTSDKTNQTQLFADPIEILRERIKSLNLETN
jgi:uncharacterized iron-regulated protein